MKKQEFINEVLKIATALGDYVRPTNKGEHCTAFLGFTCMPGTYRHAEFVWRKYGTLQNLIIFRTADEINSILSDYNITSFKARPTKSGQMCRLVAIR